MATTTPNYGWTVPTSTDLVKDGATAIETLGDAVDATVFANANAAIAKTIVDAKGDLIAATAADTVARLAVGTNGQALTADSTAATGLAWTTISANGMTQLATGTLSGATTTISGISGSYKDLQIIVRNFDPTTDGSGLAIRMNSDSTASRHLTSSTYGQWQAIAFNSTLITLTADVDNAVNQGLTVCTIYDYANATTWKMCDFLSATNNPTTSTQLEGRVGYGVYNQTAAITSIDFIVSGGAAGGTYYLYGVK